MPEPLLATPYPDEVEAAESALGQMLEAAVQVGRIQAPNTNPANLLRDLITRQGRAILPMVLDAPEQVRRRWEYLRSQGWKGHAAEVHAERQPFLDSVERKLHLVEQGRRLAELFVLPTGEALPEATKLAQAEDELRRFREEVFGNWQTLEDLEEMLAASFPLSNERLAAIAAKHRPPPEWYEEEGKPF
jgi:hypothetical protein